MSDLSAAADAIGAGELVIYPTETVYGLGGDATSIAAIERVFALKQRPRSNPLSVAVASLADVDAITQPTTRTRRFMDAFLPGPVTVVCPKRDVLPDRLTGGRDRVGVRIPDHEQALALLERTGPITATSANRSGMPSVRDPSALDDRIRDGVAVVLDGGRTPGGASTVVDVDRGEILRAGALDTAVETWLAEH